jgi:hypothetical protein
MFRRMGIIHAVHIYQRTPYSTSTLSAASATRHIRACLLETTTWAHMTAMASLPRPRLDLSRLNTSASCISRFRGKLRGVAFIAVPRRQKQDCAAGNCVHYAAGARSPRFESNHTTVVALIKRPWWCSSHQRRRLDSPDQDVYSSITQPWLSVVKCARFWWDSATPCVHSSKALVLPPGQHEPRL